MTFTPGTNITSGPAVLANDPLPAEWGMVVRGVGTFYILEPYLQRRFDLDDITVFYIGYAARGTLTSAAAWTIKRIQFNASGNPTTLEWSDHDAIWDDRLITVYS